ncbi:hypothetical protein JCM10449v2_006087 [Rhodotorula kratochvilovae]
MARGNQRDKARSPSVLLLAAIADLCPSPACVQAREKAAKLKADATKGQRKDDGKSFRQRQEDDAEKMRQKQAAALAKKETEGAKK